MKKYVKSTYFVYILFNIILLFMATSVFARQQDITIVQKDTTGIIVLLDTPDSTLMSKDNKEIEDLHPQDSPKERGFLFITADGKAQLRLRGSIRLNGGYDLDGPQSDDLFSTYEIPVGDANTTELRFFMSVNQTRLSVEAKRQTPIGDVFIRAESDFLNTPNRIRLRHAYGMVDDFLIGQTWSTFGDLSSLPWTVDLDGPNNAVSERTIQIRYRRNVSKDFRWSVAVESPSPDIAPSDTFLVKPAFQSFPDIIGRIRRDDNWGHFQLAGILRSVNVRNIIGELQYLTGFGVLLSGDMKVIAQDKIYFQIVYGKAIARSIRSLSGKGLDVVYNPGEQKFETLGVMGGFLSYSHNWQENLFSYLTVGLTNVVNKNFQPPDAFSSSQYVSANLFWETTEGTRVGMEYSFGRRVNKNDESGTANRLSFIAYYDF